MFGLRACQYKQLKKVVGILIPKLSEAETLEWGWVGGEPKDHQLLDYIIIGFALTICFAMLILTLSGIQGIRITENEIQWVRI